MCICLTYPVLAEPPRNGCDPSVFAALSRAGAFRDPNLYLWDNWIVRDGDTGLYHRYALAAPRAGNTPESRHNASHIRHFVSTDGRRWEDKGPVVSRGWSGTTVIQGSGERRRFLMFFTAVDAAQNQQIRMAVSTDGHHFSPPRLVLPPSEDMGYHIGRGDGLVMAWRDPYVFLDSRGQAHLFFAAKALTKQGVRPALGRAVAEDPERGEYRLQPPVVLPGEFRQLELPNVVERDGTYYLFVSVTHRASDSSREADVRTEARAYRSTSLEGPWEPVDKGQGIVLDSQSGMYGFNLVREFGTGNSESLMGTGFLDANQGHHAFSLPPLFPVTFDGSGVPGIQAP